MKIKEVITNTALLSSFRAIKKSFMHVIFLDFLYYVIFLFVGSFYVLRVLPWLFDAIEGAKILKETAFASTAEFLAKGTAIHLQWSSFKIYTISIFIILLLNYVFFKYFIWKKILEKKAPFKKELKDLGMFTLLNAGIVLAVVLILVGAYYLFVLDVFNIFFFFIVPLTALYTITLTHPLFVESLSFQKTAQQFFVVGIKNIYRWIIPFIIMTAGAYLVMQVVPILLFVPDAVYFVWYILCFAAYFSWCKLYVHEVIKKIGQKTK